MPLIALLALLGGIYYFTTADEKARFYRAALRAARDGAAAADRLRGQPGPFDQALHERTGLVVSTPALAVLNVGIFVCMLAAPGALADPATLVEWGANFGPRTTGGEWWRLLTAAFLHTSFFQLVFGVLALVQVGVVMERLFGRAAFASVYLGAGFIAAVVSLSMNPIGVSSSASGAVWGVVGLCLTWLVVGTIQRSPMRLPLRTVVTSLPGVALFVLYSLGAGYNGRPEMAGLVVGILYGIVLAKDAAERRPPLLRAAATMGAVVLAALPVTAPLRGLTDVRPELARVTSVEESTARTYDEAVGHFTKGEIPVGQLAALIDQKILPPLQAAHARLKQLVRVPREHQPMIAAADEYLTLRERSWRVRADALRRVKSASLRQADEMEDKAVRVLASIAPMEP